MPRKRDYIEDIATLPLDFCRETKVGDDIYQIGLLIPNNDICSERSTQGYERIIVICKNRQHHADVLELKISETQLAVKYFQIDEFDNRNKRKNNPEQNFPLTSLMKFMLR